MKRKTRIRLLALAFILLLLAVSAVLFRKPLARLYYVREYEDFISAAATEYQVPEELVCAVIWCESRFHPEAKSVAGACGLMQLAPATFQEVLWRLGLPEDGDIFSPEQNIRCGTFYLQYLYDLYGDWETVLAAYNAGMGNVNTWLADARYSDDGVSLREIPFSETASYVRKVLDTQEIYRSLYAGR